jgi:hypothetical protein
VMSVAPPASQGTMSWIGRWEMARRRVRWR